MMVKEKDKKATLYLLYMQQLNGSHLVFLFFHHSVEGQSSCMFSSALLLCFLQVHPYLKRSSAETDPLVSDDFYFGGGVGGCKPTFHIEPILRYTQ